jgi:hypothetical protein
MLLILTIAATVLSASLTALNYWLVTKRDSDVLMPYAADASLAALLLGLAILCT